MYVFVMLAISAGLGYFGVTHEVLPVFAAGVACFGMATSMAWKNLSLGPRTAAFLLLLAIAMVFITFIDGQFFPRMGASFFCGFFFVEWMCAEEEDEEDAEEVDGSEEDAAADDEDLEDPHADPA